MQEKHELSFYEVKYIAEESEKTEEQKSCLVRLQILVEKYYSSHWKLVKTPDQSQKLFNNR